MQMVFKILISVDRWLQLSVRTTLTIGIFRIIRFAVIIYCEVSKNIQQWLCSYFKVSSKLCFKLDSTAINVLSLTDFLINIIIIINVLYYYYHYY